jgi:hypothetical protein
MSYAESPQKTVVKFIKTPSWLEKISEESLVTHLTSVSQETRRRPDPGYFEVINRELVDPLTGMPILPQIKRNTPLREVEYQIAVKLQKFAVQNDSGIALWISPRFPGEYPCEKAAIHKIVYKLDGTKVLLNSYILFDANLENPEILRNILFTKPDSEEAILGILTWIQKVCKEKIETDTSNYPETKKQAKYFARKIRAGISPEIIVEEMRRTGFLGQNPISCPAAKVSFSNLLSSRSEIYIFSGQEDIYGPLEFFCPSCGKVNKRPYGQLISNCQHCGANVRC